MSGLPPQVARLVGRLAHEVFATAFIDAMRPTLQVPVAIVALGALSCQAIQRRRSVATAAPAGQQEPAA